MGTHGENTDEIVVGNRHTRAHRLTIDPVSYTHLTLPTTPYV